LRGGVKAQGEQGIGCVQAPLQSGKLLQKLKKSPNLVLDDSQTSLEWANKEWETD